MTFFAIFYELNKHADLESESVLAIPINTKIPLQLSHSQMTVLGLHKYP